MPVLLMLIITIHVILFINPDLYICNTINSLIDINLIRKLQVLKRQYKASCGTFLHSLIRNRPQTHWAHQTLRSQL